VFTATIASIPSPPFNVIELGPIKIHIYGLCIAVGVIVAILIAEKRWKARGHDPSEVGRIALWIIGGGVVGARVYHLFTGYSWHDNGFWGIFEIWRGGVSIWGAVLGGAIATIIVARVRHLDTLALMDAFAPAIAVAQAIGRWGNYFNQELFGRPTSLPWGLEIDFVHRPIGYEQYTTFQPTFLYESLWCLAVAGMVVLLERKFRLHKGQSFAAYIALYPVGRFVFENLRIDTASVILGLRLNAWVSILVMLFGVGWFVWLGKHSALAAAERASLDAPTNGHDEVATTHETSEDASADESNRVAEIETDAETETGA
jgi:prolipoprotein diacylglyceryl transferase